MFSLLSTLYYQEALNAFTMRIPTNIFNDNQDRSLITKSCRGPWLDLKDIDTDYD